MTFERNLLQTFHLPLKFDTENLPSARGNWSELVKIDAGATAHEVRIAIRGRDFFGLDGVWIERLQGGAYGGKIFCPVFDTVPAYRGRNHPPEPVCPLRGCRLTPFCYPED